MICEKVGRNEWKALKVGETGIFTLPSEKAVENAVMDIPDAMIDTQAGNIAEDYAHNLGVSKDGQGHIDSNEALILGYAYGQTWGRWNTLFQKIRIVKE